MIISAALRSCSQPPAENKHCFVFFALLLSSPVLCFSLGKNRSKKDHPNRDLHPRSRQYALIWRDTLVEAPPWFLLQMYLRLAITTMTYARVASSPWLPLPQPLPSGSPQPQMLLPKMSIAEPPSVLQWEGDCENTPLRFALPFDCQSHATA